MVIYNIGCRVSFPEGNSITGVERIEADEDTASAKARLHIEELQQRNRESVRRGAIPANYTIVSIYRGDNKIG